MTILKPKLANAVVVGIPTRSVFMDEIVNPDFVPALSVKMIDIKDRTAFYIEVFQNMTNYGFIMRSCSATTADASWREVKLLYNTAVYVIRENAEKLRSAFSVEERLNMLNALHFLLHHILRDRPSKLEFTKNSGYKSAQWEPYLSHATGAFYNAIKDYLAICDREKLAISAEKMYAPDDPAVNEWTRFIGEFMPSVLQNHLSWDGLTTLDDGRKQTAMPFCDGQRFFCKESGAGKAVPEEPGTGRVDAFFAPEVAGRYHLTGEIPYGVIDTGRDGDRQYVLVVNDRGESIWLDKSKAMLVSR